jgi:hypothetical protein
MGVVGIEHEYRVLDAGGAVLDVRTFIDRLPLDGRRLDPGDLHAVRCRWGGVITADGREAEIASPPVRLAPGATVELRRSLADGEAVLLAGIRSEVGGAALEGYSTHLSVEVADRRAVRCGRVVLHRFAPALMLLTDRRTSPGLLVRPRRHRVELCGEHVAGDDLAAAVVFGAAVVLTAERSLTQPLARRRLPPRVELRVESAVERFGWYVDRAAAGADLYAGGRATPLRAGRRWTTAGDHLARAWAAVRPVARCLAGADEVDLVDRRVDGRAALPCERGPVSGAAPADQ